MNYSGIGRAGLISMIIAREAEIVSLKEQLATMNQGVGLPPAAGITFPGWWCTRPKVNNGVACDTWNGESKQTHHVCRHCGGPRTTLAQPAIRLLPREEEREEREESPTPSFKVQTVESDGTITPLAPWMGYDE